MKRTALIAFALAAVLFVAPLFAAAARDAANAPVWSDWIAVLLAILIAVVGRIVDARRDKH